jgi:8-oxo-dGTP pyrophosphatase MutT (NUDIX family)
MNLTETYKGHSGVEYIFEYSDTDSFNEIETTGRCKQTYAVCFCDNQMVIGYGGAKKSWGLIGGTIEKGETLEQTLRREIQEESNMEILSFKPIGYQKVIDIRDNSFIYQLRYVAIVKPFGPFISDPADAITEIKLIDPKDYKKYFDWGDIGDRIIGRALELKNDLK